MDSTSLATKLRIRIEFLRRTKIEGNIVAVLEVNLTTMIWRNIMDYLGWLTHHFLRAFGVVDVVLRNFAEKFAMLWKTFRWPYFDWRLKERNSNIYQHSCDICYIWGLGKSKIHSKKVQVCLNATVRSDSVESNSFEMVKDNLDFDKDTQSIENKPNAEETFTNFDCADTIIIFFIIESSHRSLASIFLNFCEIRIMILIQMTSKKLYKFVDFKRFNIQTYFCVRFKDLVEIYNNRSSKHFGVSQQQTALFLEILFRRVH